MIGSDVFEQLPLAPSIAAGLTTDEKLAALNAAITQSWPMIKLRRRVDNAGTLSYTTFIYALDTATLGAATPLPHRDVGVANVRVTVSTSEPPRLVRDVTQYYNHDVGHWSLVFAPTVVEKYSGLTFGVEYQYPHAAVDSLNSVIDLPSNYLTDYVAFWLACRRMSDQPNEASIWRELMVLAREGWQEALRANMSPILSPVPLWRGDRMT